MNISHVVFFFFLKELVLETKDLSRVKRKKTSAGDSRTSSTAMGFSALFLLAALYLLLFVMDLRAFCRRSR